MSTVGIVFFSGTGTTRALAESVREGVEAAGATCHMLEITGADITEGRWANDAIATTLDGCDAIILGTPTYMGSVTGQMKAFMDGMAQRWFIKAWDGKLGAAFTVSSLAAGDKLGALQAMMIFAMQMCMRWIGTGANPSEGLNLNGFYLGVGAVASNPEGLQDADKQTAVHLGQRVVAALG